MSLITLVHGVVLTQKHLTGKQPGGVLPRSTEKSLPLVPVDGKKYYLGVAGWLCNHIPFQSCSLKCFLIEVALLAIVPAAGRGTGVTRRV